jgi:hypothetical protein
VVDGSCGGAWFGAAGFEVLSVNVDGDGGSVVFEVEATVGGLVACLSCGGGLGRRIGGG